MTHGAGLTEVARLGSVPLTVHLHNTGDVTLTGVTVEAPDAPDCARALGADLAPDAEVDLPCEHTPTAVGSFASTVSVTATEVAGPVRANTPEVAVVDGTEPTATLTVPADGALYEEGATVLADYGCADDQPGVTCTAPVAAGMPIDTSVGTHTFTVVATDGAGNDHEVEHTYTVAHRRPDARVRLLPDRAERGDGVYNGTGTRQATQARAATGRTVTFRLVVENDGTHPEALAVRGGRSAADYRVRYLAGSTDVTALVGRGT